MCVNKQKNREKEDNDYCPFGASPAILPTTSEPTEHNKSICLFKNLYNFLQKCWGCSDVIQEHRAPSLVQQGALTVNLFHTQLVLVWRCCCWGWCALWFSIRAGNVPLVQEPCTRLVVTKGRAHRIFNLCLFGTASEGLRGAAICSGSWLSSSS